MGTLGRLRYVNEDDDDFLDSSSKGDMRPPIYAILQV